MKYFQYIIFTIVLFLWGNSCFAQEDNLADTILFTSGFFSEDEPINIELKFNISEFKSKKFNDKTFPGNISYFFNDSTKITRDIGIEMRGISRQRICDFPPFSLKLKNSDINREYLAGSKKVKVVTLCKDLTDYKRYLYKEYLIYKLYNIITENSFRVRLVNFTLIDEGKKNKTYKKLFFIIEPEILLAERLDCIPIKMDVFNYTHTDSLATDILFMFQYMIGNTDFLVTGRHNIKLVKSVDFNEPLLIPIPYDFDFAGLISTEYAQPVEYLEIESVIERYFLGPCRSDEEYQIIIDHFKSKKEDIYNCINSFQYLSVTEKRRMIKYINQFYKIIDRDNFINKELRRTCRD